MQKELKCDNIKKATIHKKIMDVVVSNTRLKSMKSLKSIQAPEKPSKVKYKRK